MGVLFYFGELIVEMLFVYFGSIVEKFWFIEYLCSYYFEFLKVVVFFFNVMLLVDVGLINFILDFWIFDYYFCCEIMVMVEECVVGIDISFWGEFWLEELVCVDFM